MLKGSRPSPIGARNGSLHAFFTQACTLNLMHSCRQDGSGLDIANAWWVDVTVHYVRKVSYRGHRAQVNRNRLKLPFDGLTFPATLFTVPWTCLRNNDLCVKRARSCCTRNRGVQCAADSRLPSPDAGDHPFGPACVADELPGSCLRHCTRARPRGRPLGRLRT